MSLALSSRCIVLVPCACNVILAFLDIFLYLKYSRHSMTTLKVPFTLRQAFGRRALSTQLQENVSNSSTGQLQPFVDRFEQLVR